MRGLFIAVSILAAAGAAAFTLAPAAVAQAGTERSFTVGAFESIAVAGPHNVVVTPGRTHSVRASGPADALDRLEVEVQRGALRIGTKRGSWLRPFQGNVRGVTVHVTAPR